MTRYAFAERLALASLLEEVGPLAPTLCGTWTARDLVAHLLLRERRVDAGAGIVIKRFAGRTRRIQEEIAARPYSELLRDLRNPPWWSPLANPMLDEAVNLAEMFVHLEDVRRARPGWQPRDLPAGYQRALFKQVSRRSRLVLRKFKAVIHVEAPGFGAARGGAGGLETVRILGTPGELLLFLFGRQAHSAAAVDGPAVLVERLQRARLGI